MSKTCKDFGEVLVALGQGKTVVDEDGRQVKIKDNGPHYRIPSTGEWSSLYYDMAGFSYPAPIYEEPKTVEVNVWLNVYPDGDNSNYSTKAKADEGAGLNRLACINIKRTVTEGEGLE